VEHNGNLNKDQVIKTCQRWLTEKHYGASRAIWCTQYIEPKIMVQKVIGDNPIDYKFHMIHGRCAFISVHTMRGIGVYPKKCLSYDINWNVLPFTFQQAPALPVRKPKELQRMIEIAEILSKPFNYVRVDLYYESRIYFGELTHFPNSGAGRFTPQSWDYEYGKLFKKWQES